jgi:hypothetical protein
MTRQGFGLFAGFDLENNKSSRDLATGLEYWLGGGRDDHGVELKKLTHLQQATIGMVAQRMANSPLLTQIITLFLRAPRLRGRNKSLELLAAGRDLRDYAIPGSEEPRAAAYQDTLTAWENR